MLKPKIVRLILDELKGLPFYIEGESYPYRIKKDGGVERLAGVWIESSYSYMDLIAIIDNKRVNLIEEPLHEQSAIRKQK